MNGPVSRAVPAPGAEPGPLGPCRHGRRHSAARGPTAEPLRVRSKDPGELTAAERVSEIGAILAAGFYRQRENRSKPLDDRGHSERGCEIGVVDSPENPEEGSA